MQLEEGGIRERLAGRERGLRELIEAVQRSPATEYLLIEPSGQIFGVLAADVELEVALRTDVVGDEGGDGRVDVAWVCGEERR